MESLAGMGRFLIMVGLVVTALGVVLMLFGRIPLLGRLPGDVVIRRGNFTFYFPLVTSLVLSAVLTLVFLILRK